MEQYLREIDRKERLQPWQFRQVFEATQILFANLIWAECEDDVDWEYWLASARELEVSSHSTLGRIHDPGVSVWAL